MSATPDPASVRSRPLPVGTVTFAFTDIEGSTVRWERDRVAMHDAVRRHDAVVRAAIEAHDGVVFKTIGDAFCAAFARPQDAIAAMIAAQVALAGEDFAAAGGIRVRAAIHTGTTEERDGDYFGPTVNRVARLLTIGNGGQILVTGVSTDLVQGVLPSRATLHDLGQHRLKDLTFPEQVYQVLAPELPRDFPPLRSLDILANNLPRQVTALIGREREVDEVTALLEEAALVTLVGSGGVGKTRVSLQVAANLVDGSGDGVWFVEFAPIRDPDLIPLTIANAAGITLSERGSRNGALIDALKEKKLLLVLDNCEHLVEGVAEVAAAIVRSCSHVKMLASSREGLGIEGEAVYRMPSLAAPPESAIRAKADEIRSYGAVELFVNRASMALRSFTLTDANAQPIAEIVRRLDGIPLALELAATRLNVLSPDQLLARLEDRLRLLTGGDRTRMPRQQTLRALIDWSYDLLSERERLVFRRLGIFVGGWTLETAASLVETDGIDEWDVLDILTSLVSKSLVVADVEEGTTPRYRLLESTRQYARDRLAQHDDLQTISQRHAGVFLAMVERMEEARFHVNTTAAVLAVVPELDNIRTALRWALGPDGDLQTAARIAAASRAAWSAAGAYVEAYQTIVPVLKRVVQQAASVDAGVIARLQLAVAVAGNSLRRESEISETALAALQYFRSVDDPPRRSSAANACAVSILFSGRYDEAEAYLHEAVTIERAGGIVRHLAMVLAKLVTLDLIRGRLSEARENATETLRLWESVDDRRGIEETTVALAEIEFACGNVEEAIRLIERLTVSQEHSSDKLQFGGTLINLTAYYLRAQRYAEACSSASRVLTIVDHTWPAFQFVLCEHIALLAAVAGDLERAALLFGFADDRRRRSGAEREPTERFGFERLSTLLETLEPSLREQLLKRGAALDDAGVAAQQRAALEAFPSSDVSDQVAGGGSGLSRNA